MTTRPDPLTAPAANPLASPAANPLADPPADPLADPTAAPAAAPLVDLAGAALVDPAAAALAFPAAGPLAGPPGDRSADAALAELEHYRARFHAIVGNTPGLVYQFTLGTDGAVAFPYLSEGCAALLGLPAALLQAEPERFLQLILPEDRRAYGESMRTSVRHMSGWNWEGRIWIAAWNDVKWINLRASPRPLAAPAGTVMWEGIMSNITASKLEQLEATRSRARLAELSAHSDAVKEQERTRIAREIHDELGGNLTAIKMALAMLAKRLPPDQPQLADKAAYVDALVDRTIDAVHRISLDLRPSMLDFGIVAALEWQLKEFEKQNGIACAFSSNEKDIALSQAHATALFRIFQEALTNIAKHAGARRVEVLLQRLRHQIVLKVSDDGKGIAPADRAKPRSFGLRGMQERAEALGGTMAVAPTPGGGATVSIKIMLAPSTQPLHYEQAPGTGAAPASDAQQQDAK